MTTDDDNARSPAGKGRSSKQALMIELLLRPEIATVVRRAATLARREGRAA